MKANCQQRILYPGNLFFQKKVKYRFSRKVKNGAIYC